MSEKDNTKPAPHGQHANIATALAAAQSEMGRALKSANNPHLKSKYADLASVMDACIPALNGHGIAVIQPTTDVEGGRYVETVLIHGTSDESLRCRVPLIVAKNDMQGYGSAVTYARRYGLMSMAGIAPEDDDGQAAVKAPPPKDNAPKNPVQKPDTSLNDIDWAIIVLSEAQSLPALKAAWSMTGKALQEVPGVLQAKDVRKAELEHVTGDSAADLDGIPY